MFATLLGGLPRPDTFEGKPIRQGHGAPDHRLVAVRAQEEAGLEPITDGRTLLPSGDLTRLVVGVPGFEGRGLAGIEGSSDGPVVSQMPEWRRPMTLRGWKATAAMTDRAVKQALPGPYTLGRRARLQGQASMLGSRERLTLSFAAALRQEVRALAEAGCPLIEIEETEAHRIGEDESERRLFREAHLSLTDGIAGTHLSLSIVGGSAAEAGIETILAAPYASLAIDLIAGPDNWNLVVRTPGDRGLIAGVLSGQEASDEAKELMLWAAQYAASSGGRGPLRVGLGSAGSYANLAWDVAVRKMGRLGEAARLAEMPPGRELARKLDPRAVSIRTAALGHDAPPPPRRRARKGG